MDANARLQSIDQIGDVVIAVGRLLAVLLENGPAFSTLIARHASAEPGDGAVVLEDCTQFRIEADGGCYSRLFPVVKVRWCKETGYWTASPDGFRSLFSQPSEDAYAILQLGDRDSERVEELIDADGFDDLFELLRQRFGGLPRFFSPDESELHAPERYATGRDGYPVPVEFL